MVQHLLVHGVQHVLDSAGHKGRDIVTQHSDFLHEHARMLSLDGGIKVFESFTVALCIDGDVEVLLSKGCRFRSYENIKFIMVQWLQKHPREF
jgi:hypothetical protein